MKIFDSVSTFKILSSLPKSAGSFPGFHYLLRPVNNFIANILSKALLSFFTDFYSPLKNA